MTSYNKNCYSGALLFNQSGKTGVRHLSIIEKSLAELRASVENLEASFQLFEEARAASNGVAEGEQHDMFPSGTGSAVTQRLDTAIKNVEALIGEA